ncbi:hypothetical protein [Bacillus sp. FJAT-45350]|uniref:hypothetical protein n=1 Tax=Bacillus sp. FJAT-45350 TaxID=2011014 RepID=UPI0011551F95|nr:hypothetical protein [Bacillus sp. FJAT-45350]
MKTLARLGSVVEADDEKPTVVLVEDDNILALLLNEQLRSHGFNVHHVRDGDYAIQVTKWRSVVSR